MKAGVDSMEQRGKTMFNQSRILSYAEVKAITPGDSPEPLVDLRGKSPLIHCEYEKMDMLPYTGESMLLRSSVAERLVQAAELLAREVPGSLLKLVYAYRHPEVQTRYFERESRRIRERNPEISEAELQAKAHLFVAVPEVAGHPTGGAVDVTILGTDGAPLDMGTGIADFTDEERITVFSTRITPEQRTNRMLLRRAMMSAEFAPFDGEWWHFSYGDREWAAYYGKSSALFGPISTDTSGTMLCARTFLKL